MDSADEILVQQLVEAVHAWESVEPRTPLKMFLKAKFPALTQEKLGLLLPQLTARRLPGAW